MLLFRIAHLVSHDISSKFNYILKSIYLNFNDSSIRIEIALASLFSPDAVNADAKLLNQQLFEAFLLYSTSGHLGSYSI